MFGSLGSYCLNLWDCLLLHYSILHYSFAHCQLSWGFSNAKIFRKLFLFSSLGEFRGGRGEKSANVFVLLKDLVSVTWRTFGILPPYFSSEDGYRPCFWNTVPNRKQKEIVKKNHCFVIILFIYVLKLLTWLELTCRVRYSHWATD